MAQYVYTMNRVGKIVPPKRQILKDISLSFFPGAKIGVLGLNGSGKSTLLKIMAGIDKEIEGEATPMPGLNIGYLPQEPKLNPEHTVRESVEEAHGRSLRRQGQARGGLRRLRRARRRLRRAGRRAGTAGSRSSPPPAPTPSTSWKSPPTRCACRRGTPRSACCRAARSAAWRCAACCCPSPTCCCWTSRPTTWTPNRSSGWKCSCTRFSGTVVAITHDRYFLDNAAEWILELDRGRGIPWKGNYSTWLEQKGDRLDAGAEDRRRPRQGAEEGTGVVAPEPQGAPGQEQVAPGPLRGAVRLRIPEAQRDAGDLHSRGRAPGQRGDRVQERQQVLRRPPADRQPELQGAGRAPSSASSAPTAPASRRCSS